MKFLFIFLMEACRFCGKMFWYLALPMIASVLTTATVPAEEMQSCCMILAPPSFIMNMVLFGDEQSCFRAKCTFFLLSVHPTLQPRHVKDTECCCHMLKVTRAFQTFRQLLIHFVILFLHKFLTDALLSPLIHDGIHSIPWHI